MKTRIIIAALSAIFAFGSVTAKAEGEAPINAFSPPPSSTAEPGAANTPPSPEITTALAVLLYPSSVDVDEGNRRIVKVYELDIADDPADIPRESFERGGVRYALADVIRSEVAVVDTVPHTETVTLNADSKELEAVLPLLSPTLDFVSDDGYCGTLTLDISTLTVAESETEKRAYTMSTTREYPRLSNSDTSLIPKTVTERGLTYTLANVDWRSGNNENVDYNALPEYYTAVATYSVSGVSTKVTGYAVTAEYKGELTKQLQGKTVYTAYFEGAPVEPTQTPEPTPTQVEAPEQSKRQSSGFGAFPLIAVLLGVTAIALLLILLPFGNVKVFNLKDGRYNQIGRKRAFGKSPIIDLTPFTAKAASGNFILVIGRLSAKYLNGKTVTINYGDRTLRHVVNHSGGEYQIEVDF